MAAAAFPPRPSPPAVVWSAVRPFSLPISAIPVVVGTAAVAASRQVRPLTALACLVIAVLVQSGTNALNDAEDALTGADATPMAMPSLAMRAGWIDSAAARRVAIGCFAVAGALGIATALLSGHPWLLLLGAAGIVVGVAYTAPPLRLAYTPLGELASGVPMGVGILVGTAAAQAGSIPTAAWCASIPLALLTAGVLHANNARDRDHDALVGKRTMATRVPIAAVVLEYRLLTVLVPVSIAAALALRALPWECALALVPGAMAVRLATRARADLGPMEWTMLLLGCVKLMPLVGAALTVGLLIGALT